MNKALLLTLLLVFTLGAKSFAQCSPTAAEIPGNGIDEDCDGLDDIYLHLPPYIYMVAGQNFELYFRNAILSQHPNDYNFTVTTALSGTSSSAKWSFTPSSAHVGTHPLMLTVKSQSGQTLATASTSVRISPSTAPTNMATKKLVLYGHSFYDQGYLPKYLNDLTNQAGNPPITYHGTRQSWAAPFPKHEGYGGYMWRWFLQSPSSPFRNGANLDLQNYFNNVIGPNQDPDWMIIHLDINDYCGYTPLTGLTLQEIDDSIAQNVANNVNPILNAIRAAAPNMKIGICYSPMPNGRQSAFDLTYPNSALLRSRWRWQKIISRTLFSNSALYANRENENIYLIPEHLDLDDLAEYPEDDARHPDPPDNNINTHCGYKEIAKSIYAWIKYVEHLQGASQTYYRDADGDGFGNPLLTVTGTFPPTGYVTTNTDCNDSNANVNPSRTEVCNNNIDDNCNGTTDEDTTPPSITCLDVTKHLDEKGTAIVRDEDIIVTGTDNCGAYSVITNFSQTLTCADLNDALERTIQVSDTEGNITPCTVQIVILNCKL